MIGHAERIIFLWWNIYLQTCRCWVMHMYQGDAPSTGTNWPSINVRRWYNDLCRQPSLYLAIRRDWFNAPWYFSLGATTTVDWTRRTSCSALLADRCCDDIKHAMRYRADCLNTYCKNMTFSIKWCVQLFVFNSDPYGWTPSPAHNS